MLRISLERLKRNIPQQKLAEMAGLSQATLSRLEHGKLYPYPNWKKRLGNALGVNPESLFQEVKCDEETGNN